MTIGLLGGFSLDRAGSALPAPHSAQRLIALLALSGRPLRRTYIAGVLWPDVPEQRAMATLRSTLWRVRQIDGHLLVGNADLRLGSGLDVDVATFRSLVRRLLDDDEPGVEKVVRCADLAGELLPDWYEDWVIFERERIRQLRLHALEALAARLSRAGSYADAVEAAVVAIESEPLRESSHRSLIDVHLASGNYSEALRVYRAYEGLAARELGVGPSPLMRSQMDGLIDR